MRKNEQISVVAGNRVKTKRSFTIKNPVVLITADSRSCPQDIEKFLRFGIPHDVYCVARSYKAYPGKMNHWADVDGDSSVWWAENLPKEKIHPDILRHTLGSVRGFDVDWDVIGSVYDMDEVLWHGSTGLFAVYTALAMGYEKLILAGMALDCNGHWYDPPDIRGPRWNGETFQAWLDFARTEESNKVKSMSGYTEQMLGKPTMKWLKEWK